MTDPGAGPGSCGISRKGHKKRRGEGKMCGICERIQMTRNDQDQKVILVIDTEKLSSEVR